MRELSKGRGNVQIADVQKWYGAVREQPAANCFKFVLIRWSPTQIGVRVVAMRAHVWAMADVKTCNVPNVNRVIHV